MLLGGQHVSKTAHYHHPDRDPPLTGWSRGSGYPPRNISEGAPRMAADFPPKNDYVPTRIPGGSTA
jgi:hypothetical protein